MKKLVILTTLVVVGFSSSMAFADSIFAATKRPGAAMADYNQSLELNQESRRARVNRADLKADLGDMDGALED